jgi:hypothetical protein
VSDLEEQLKATVVDAKAAMLTDSRRCLISFGRRSNAAGVFKKEYNILCPLLKINPTITYC